MSRTIGPQTPFPERATLADLVEEQAAATPTAVAVIHEDEQLSYGDLLARTTPLARYLQQLGVGPDVRVAVFLDRSIELAVALLAVQQAGGTCLPLDPSYPLARLALMLDDAVPAVLLTRKELASRLPTCPGHVVALDADAHTIAETADELPIRATGPQDLAYVIYTSGSSGAPKGVMLTHRGLVNHHAALARLYKLGPGSRVLQFCSIGFDVSIEETFPTWASGGALVLRPDDLPVLGAAWLQWLTRMRISMLNLPTAYWHEWVSDLQRLGEKVPACVGLVVVGGEKALGSTYRSWLRVGGDRVRWINAYGPAEASVAATVYEPGGDFGRALDRDPPIGRPIANTTITVLDERGRDVPVGEIGDLHIGGVGLARGYLNSPELTAERFVEHPATGERLYRTGDLVRLLADGDLEFAGRADEQVKIRGFRIEPSEVESVLSRHPEVAETTVLAREDEPGRRRLVAYVVAASTAAAQPSGLRRFLSERLPPYMIPSAFVRLAGLPLTPNGKVDREALPAPGEAGLDPADDRVAPRTMAERTLAEIWSRILGMQGIGVDDDFFDLGGHSLQAAQVVAEVSEAFAVELGVRALFEAPTIARLAASVA
ncbi:MAG: non-ribosomal peptide synthetase, partial [Solirubrobacterales bacterium]|nr:non-ribosomal peptide synthetase [Solirubrobacterales bacterium]